MQCVGLVSTAPTTCT